MRYLIFSSTRQSVPTTQRSEQTRMTDTSSHSTKSKMSQRAMSIDNISFLSPPISKPLQYEYDQLIDADANNHENDQRLNDEYENENNEEGNIIPWKKLLRKTKSAKYVT